MPEPSGPGGVLGRMGDQLGEMGTGLYSFLWCLVLILVLGMIGIARKEPWVFPSLGPTLMLFFETPTSRPATPKDAAVGHLIGIIVGAACLRGFGFVGHPPATVEGLTYGRILAAGLSLGATALTLRLLRSPHPPAGATTLIVSLGVLQTVTQLRTMILAVLVAAVLGWSINQVLGVRHPLVPVDSSG